MKTFKTSVVLETASGVALGGDFSEMHECLTHLLGWDVFTHEMADKAVWDQARANACQAVPPLKPYIDELDADRPNWEDIRNRCVRDLGETLSIPKGSGERTEHPLESLQRIAPDKPVVVVSA